MSGEIFVYVIVVVVVVGLALGVWVFDARRNKEVALDEERVEPDVDTPPSVDPTDPLHRRH